MDSGATAGPGVDPGAPATAGTLFAALLGQFVPHAATGYGASVDACSAFLQRSAALGWLDETSAGGGSEDGLARATGLWAMDDAGLGAATSSGEQLVSWFQVGARAPAADRPLPVQPFLDCAAQATAKLGVLTLGRVQVLLPVQGIDASSRPASALVPALATQDWFVSGPRGPRVPVRVSVSSGVDPSLGEGAGRFADLLLGLDQAVLTGTSAVAGLPAEDRPPPFEDDFWNGPARHGVQLRGEIAEWSCDALGWLAAVVADCAAHAGVRSPLLFDATRVTAPD